MYFCSSDVGPTCLRSIIEQFDIEWQISTPYILLSLYGIVGCCVFFSPNILPDSVFIRPFLVMRFSMN